MPFTPKTFLSSTGTTSHMPRVQRAFSMQHGTRKWSHAVNTKRLAYINAISDPDLPYSLNTFEVNLSFSAAESLQLLQQNSHAVIVNSEAHEIEKYVRDLGKAEIPHTVIYPSVKQPLPVVKKLLEEGKVVQVNDVADHEAVFNALTRLATEHAKSQLIVHVGREEFYLKQGLFTAARHAAKAHANIRLTGLSQKGKEREEDTSRLRDLVAHVDKALLDPKGESDGSYIKVQLIDGWVIGAFDASLKMHAYSEIGTSLKYDNTALLQKLFRYSAQIASIGGYQGLTTCEFLVERDKHITLLGIEEGLTSSHTLIEQQIKSYTRAPISLPLFQHGRSYGLSLNEIVRLMGRTNTEDWERHRDDSYPISLLHFHIRLVDPSNGFAKTAGVVRDTIVEDLHTFLEGHASEIKFLNLAGLPAPTDPYSGYERGATIGSIIAPLDTVKALAVVLAENGVKTDLSTAIQFYEKEREITKENVSERLAQYMRAVSLDREGSSFSR